MFLKMYFSHFSMFIKMYNKNEDEKNITANTQKNRKKKVKTWSLQVLLIILSYPIPKA